MDTSLESAPAFPHASHFPSTTPELASAADTVPASSPSPLGDDADLVQRLRSLLRHHLTGVSVEHAAERLGTSPRTLQRHLAARGTSFQHELDAIRLVEAESQLRAGVRSITQIARDIGFASSQSFWRHFRKLRGLSPSAWRRAHEHGALGAR